ASSCAGPRWSCGAERKRPRASRSRPAGPVSSVASVPGSKVQPTILTCSNGPFSTMSPPLTNSPSRTSRAPLPPVNTHGRGCSASRMTGRSPGRARTVSGPDAGGGADGAAEGTGDVGGGAGGAAEGTGGAGEGTGGAAEGTGGAAEGTGGAG